MIMGNGYEHKCPCCSYEVEVNWKRNGYSYIKGDEDFIKIVNPFDKMGTFETDREKEYSFENEKVVLLGCPKCSCVSYKFW